MILWITGDMNAGKTTLARRLRGKNTVVLDGNELRGVWPGLTLSEEDRVEQCLRLARLAALLEAQGFAVIVAAIAPYEDLRQEIQRVCQCEFVYLTHDAGDDKQQRKYEKPTDPAIIAVRNETKDEN